MDNHDEQNSNSETEQSSQPDSASSAENLDDFELPETPEHLPDTVDELKPLIHERDQAIEILRLRNEELQQKLTEREKVVTALTSRLEQAAEQLDRLHRSGADRGGKLLSGIPAEVIDEQRELISDLKSAINHWEDLQSTSAMGRFEAQLAELREMLAEQLQLKSKLSSTNTTGTSGKDKTTSPTSQPSNGGGSWNEMKARLLGEQGGASTDESSDIKVPGSEMIPGAESDSTPDEPPPEKPVEENFGFTIKDRPEPIADLAKADPDVLRSAVTVREEYIDHLLEAIEHLNEQAGMADLEESRNRQLELEDKLRKSEIEMSMERAKLAREESRLKQLEQELSNPSSPRKKPTEGSSENDDEGGNRWVRFLGSK